MDIMRGRTEHAEVTRRSDTFTGMVWSDPLFRSTDGVAMSNVYFAPGARTHWHRHDGGQILHVTSGEGLVATRDGDAARVRAGDIVWTPAGEEHWHGATAGTFVTHLSAGIGDTTWLDEVDPTQYDLGHEHRAAGA